MTRYMGVDNAIDLLGRTIAKASDERHETTYKRTVGNIKAILPDKSATAPEHMVGFDAGFKQAISRALEEVDEAFGMNEMPF